MKFILTTLVLTLVSQANAAIQSCHYYFNSMESLHLYIGDAADITDMRIAWDGKGDCKVTPETETGCFQGKFDITRSKLRSEGEYQKFTITDVSKTDHLGNQFEPNSPLGQVLVKSEFYKADNRDHNQPRMYFGLGGKLHHMSCYVWEY